MSEADAWALVVSLSLGVLLGFIIRAATRRTDTDV